jgi:anionic cell wall polymer biosynthesis LytR-Cps2A-Psr (LCP) family protein
MALWYVRSRMSTSDIDRLRRAQEVLLAISKKLFNLNAISRIPELYQAYRSSVVTDLTLEDVLQMLPILRILDADRIERYAVTFNETTAWIEPGSNRYYLLPDMDAIRQILLQAVGTQ